MEDVRVVFMEEVGRDGLVSLVSMRPRGEASCFKFDKGRGQMIGNYLTVAKRFDGSYYLALRNWNKGDFRYVIKETKKLSKINNLLFEHGYEVRDC